MFIGQLAALMQLPPFRLTSRVMSHYPPMPNAIQVEDVKKIYRTRGDAVRALDGVSFDVPQGRIYGLLGPNGAGKSTLVKILSTITTPTSGKASVMGFDVEREPLLSRQQMTVVL